MELDANLVWGLFTRLLGLVMAWAIGQNLVQAKALVSDEGISPMSTKLNRIQRDFGLRNGFWYFPTLLWISSKLSFIRFLLLLGIFCGLAVFFGLPGTGYYFLVGFLVYLSFDIALGFSYPWDSLLFEAVFLGVFLPQLPLLPELASASQPHAVVAFLYRFLLFRLLFGFGKYKFSKPNFKDSGYFKNFLINVPLPSPLASLVSRLPSWTFIAMYAFAFIAEMIIPFLQFIPGETRIICFIVIFCLMFGIQLLSNFGFFNLLTVVLAVVLLDTQSLIYRDWHFDGSLADTGFAVLLVSYVGLGLISLPLNTWCSFTWMHWPVAFFLKGHWLNYPVSFLRWISRFRLIHAYGVFPVRSQPPMKLVPLIEGSMDGENWKRYHYKFTLSEEKQKLNFIAPYHPRIDHAVFYDGFAVNNTNFNWSTVGSSLPHDYASRGGMDNILQGILQGNKSLKSLMGKDPFQNERPKYLRVGLYYAIPTEELNKRELHLADIHRLPMQVEEDYDLLSDSPPELYHWDALFWRSRSKAGKAWKALSTEDDFEKVLIALQEGLNADMVAKWQKLASTYGFIESDWEQWIEAVRRFESDYTLNERRELHRYWNRIRILIGYRLEKALLANKKHAFGGDYFAFGLWIHSMMSEGKESIEKYWNDPERMWVDSQDFTAMDGFYIEAFWRPEASIDHYRKMLWSEKVAEAQTDKVLPGFNKIALGLSALPIDCSLRAWPSMDYSEKNGEWSLGNPLPPDAIHPDLYKAYQNKIPAPIPY